MTASDSSGSITGSTLTHVLIPISFAALTASFRSWIDAASGSHFLRSSSSLNMIVLPNDQSHRASISKSRAGLVPALVNICTCI